MTDTQSVEIPESQAQAQPTETGGGGWSLSFFAWLLIALLAVIALLVLVNAGIFIVRTLDRPKTVAAGSLLYASDFANTADEWYQYQSLDSAQVTSGSLHITLGDAKGMYSPLRFDFGDFDVRANVTRLQSPDQYDQAALIFRYQDPSNFYALLTRGDGSYSVERHKDDQIDVISQFHALPNFLTGPGLTNQMRVVGKGNHYKFYVNDQLLTLCPSGPGKAKSTWNGDQCLSNNGQTVTEWLDDALSDGKIAVGARANAPGVELAFNNIVVYTP